MIQTPGKPSFAEAERNSMPNQQEVPWEPLTPIRCRPQNAFRTLGTVGFPS